MKSVCRNRNPGPTEAMSLEAEGDQVCLRVCQHESERERETYREREREIQRRGEKEKENPASPLRVRPLSFTPSVMFFLTTFFTSSKAWGASGVLKHVLWDTTAHNTRR